MLIPNQTTQCCSLSYSMFQYEQYGSHWTTYPQQPQGFIPPPSSPHTQTLTLFLHPDLPAAPQSTRLTSPAHPHVHLTVPAVFTCVAGISRYAASEKPWKARS